MRLRVIQALFAIYRFNTDSGMDLDEDIPGLLIGNTTRQERQIIASWVQDALAKGRGSNHQHFQSFLSDLQRADSVEGV